MADLGHGILTVNWVSVADFQLHIRLCRAIRATILVSFARRVRLFLNTFLFFVINIVFVIFYLFKDNFICFFINLVSFKNNVMLLLIRFFQSYWNASTEFSIWLQFPDYSFHD